jgi:hypothetical protein
VGRQAALSADPGHMFAVATHRLAPFPPGGSRLFRSELVGRAPLVSGLTPAPRDFPLFFLIHRRKPALSSSHDLTSFRPVIGLLAPDPLFQTPNSCMLA